MREKEEKRRFMALPPYASPSLAFTFSRTFTSSDERTKMRPRVVHLACLQAFSVFQYATKTSISSNLHKGSIYSQPSELLSSADGPLQWRSRVMVVVPGVDQMGPEWAEERSMATDMTDVCHSPIPRV